MNGFSNASKFVQNYVGIHGRKAQKEAKELVNTMQKKFYGKEIIIEGDGSAKWATNGMYIPEECAEALAYIQIYDGIDYLTRKTLMNFDIKSTRLKRNEQIEQECRWYKIAKEARA